MTRTLKVKADSTADDAVYLCIETAWQSRHSEAVNYLLSRLPFQPKYSWFQDMFWLIDSLTTYDYDKPGREQIKTPDRFLFKDKIGDCDDYSTLWLALLYRLGVTAWPKIVNYGRDKYWDHIYVIVPLQKSRKGKDMIILDNVYGKFRFKFDKEVDHLSAKVFKDTKRTFYGISFN